MFILKKTFINPINSLYFLEWLYRKENKKNIKNNNSMHVEETVVIKKRALKSKQHIIFIRGMSRDEVERINRTYTELDEYRLCKNSNKTEKVHTPFAYKYHFRKLDYIN